MAKAMPFLEKRTLSLCLFFLAAASCTSKRAEITNRAVLEVNGSELTSQELAQLLAEKIKGVDSLQARSPALLSQIKEEILKEFIMTELARKFAQENSIIVKAEELDGEISAIRSRYPDDLSFRQFLATEGLSFEGWRAKLSSRLLQSKVLQFLDKNQAEPTTHDLQEYYRTHQKDFERPETYMLRQIVVQNEIEADTLLAKIKAGREFGALAKEFSVTPEGRDGGILPPMELGTLEVFDQIIKKAQKKTTEKIKSAYGVHIIQYLGKNSAKTLSFDEAKDLVRRRILESRSQELYSKWLEERLKKTRVSRNDELIESIKVEVSGK